MISSRRKSLRFNQSMSKHVLMKLVVEEQQRKSQLLAEIEEKEGDSGQPDQLKRNQDRGTLRQVLNHQE